MQEIFYYLIVTFVSYLMNVFIHELGHYIFGKLTGYNLIEFKIFFISIYNDRIEYTNNFQSYCIMYCSKIQKRNFLLYNLGGIILNLIFLFLFIIFNTIYPNFITLINIFLIIIILSFNIFPYKYTDMYIVLYLLKNKKYLSDYFNYLELLHSISYNRELNNNFEITNVNIFTAAIKDIINKHNK